jgi:hypothetical protein
MATEPGVDTQLPGATPELRLAHDRGFRKWLAVADVVILGPRSLMAAPEPTPPVDAAPAIVEQPPEPSERQSWLERQRERDRRRRNDRLRALARR